MTALLEIEVKTAPYFDSAVGLEQQLKELKKDQKAAASQIKRRNEKVAEYDRLRTSFKSSGSSGYEAKRLLKAKEEYEAMNRLCKAELPMLLETSASTIASGHAQLVDLKKAIDASWTEAALQPIPSTGNAGLDKLAVEIQELQKKSSSMLAGIPEVTLLIAVKERIERRKSSLGESPESPTSPKDVPTVEIEAECNSPIGTKKPMMSELVQRSFTIEKCDAGKKSCSESGESEGRKSFEDFHKEQTPTDMQVKVLEEPVVVREETAEKTKVLEEPVVVREETEEKTSSNSKIKREESSNNFKDEKEKPVVVEQVDLALGKEKAAKKKSGKEKNLTKLQNEFRKAFGKLNFHKEQTSVEEEPVVVAVEEKKEEIVENAIDKIDKEVSPTEPKIKKEKKKSKKSEEPVVVSIKETFSEIDEKKSPAFIEETFKTTNGFLVTEVDTNGAEVEIVRKAIGKLKFDKFESSSAPASEATTVAPPPLPSSKSRVAALAAKLEASKIIFRPMMPGARPKSTRNEDVEEDEDNGTKPFMAAPLNLLALKYPKKKKLEVPPKPVKKRYVVALYDFPGQAKGDLSFKKGDKIEVLTRSDYLDDWWTGRLRGTIGIFPANYTKSLF